MKSLSQKKEDLSLLIMRARDIDEEIGIKIKILNKIRMDIQILRDNIRRDEAIS